LRPVLSPLPLGFCHPAVIQLISKTPCMPQAASNTSLGLGDLRMPSSMLYWLFLPSSLLAAATLAVSPLLLVTILRNHGCDRAHYLLLANILLSDLAYVLLHMLISSSSLGGWELGRMACGILTDAVFCFLSAAVLHTYLAAVALIWLVAFCFPTFLLWLSKWQDAQLEEEGASCILPLSMGTQQGCGLLAIVTYTSILCVLFLCMALIAYCFWRIYAEAKTSGIWGQGYSRASGTLLIHSVLITLYVSTGVLFSLDMVLTRYHHIDSGTHKWLLAANSEVLMMLPRAMLPYLYLLRYRQLLGTVPAPIQEAPGRLYHFLEFLSPQCGKLRLKIIC
uniref:G-protein coupled receptors family 1 profile domain-containing protein n=1 Tax=Macaca fascicularis TaxID=9541 RepID=A0A7N9D6P3_MACFA